MSALTSLLPLLVLTTLVAGAAYIGYQIYLWSTELATRGQAHMEKKHMSFTKDGGLRVEVKNVSPEEYADKTQRVLVDTWNTSSTGTSKGRPGSGAPEQRGGKRGGSTSVPGGW